MTDSSEPLRGAQLSLAEVAEACGVSLSTVKRRQDQFTHAYKDPRGVWRVPVGDLLAAGLQLRSWSAVEVGEPVTRMSDPAERGHELDDARAKIGELTEQLTAERVARAAAEASASAYRDNLTDLRRSLNAITGPPAVSDETPAQSYAPVQGGDPVAPRGGDPVVPRRRWPWSRSVR